MSKEKRIILVEDDPDHAYLITDILEGACHEKDIVLVRDGKDAIDYFQEFSVKCNGQAIKDIIKMIIIDLNLPKVSGMEVLKYLKKNSKYSQIPVAILSTSANEKSIIEAYENGAAKFLTKPVSYKEFITELSGLKEYYRDIGDRYQQ
jgi:DNA-binding response OmpR family regulator